MELSDEKIAAVVREVIAAEFEVEPTRITQEAHLFTDLGLDSLDGIDLIVALEKRFGVKVDEEAAKQFRRVGDVCTFIAHVRDRPVTDGRGAKGMAGPPG